MAKGQLVRIGTFASAAQDLDAAIEAFLNYCRTKNLSENTLIYYAYRLSAFRRFLRETAGCTAPADVTAQRVREFVAQETSSNSPSTANHSITTLKAFFNYLVEDGFLDRSPMTVVKKVKTRSRILETFSTEQIETLLKTCGRNFVGVRDRAIVLVLFDCGHAARERSTPQAHCGRASPLHTKTCYLSTSSWWATRRPSSESLRCRCGRWTHPSSAISSAYLFCSRSAVPSSARA